MCIDLKLYLLMALISLLPYIVIAQTSNKSFITGFMLRAVKLRRTEGFVHPGIVPAVNDLDRIQTIVRQGYEPWATAFDHFRSSSKASKGYIIQNVDRNGNPRNEEMADGDGQYEARRDADCNAFNSSK